MKKHTGKGKKKKKKHNAPTVSVPFVEPDFIENTSYKCVRFQDDRVCLDEIFKRLSPALGLKLVYSEKPSKEIGSIDFPSLTLTVFTLGRTVDVQRFALACLIGHVVMGHGSYMMSAVCYEQFTDIDLRSRVSAESSSSIDWQSRFFACCLLMPRQVFNGYFVHLQGELGFKNRGHGPIYLDNQPCNQLLYSEILNEMRIFFSVPKFLVEFRINSLKLLVDARMPIRVAEEAIGKIFS
ncbi:MULTISPECIES: ImmA/IrrE family metallo-endopeptidase [unclassified Pseudomonas]|uniref:ImmA/IrrE family metallo-endopeptidase n=1 Tax=unclassified Pseudomonas TaxID=196821 RepID=UPI000C86B563|nr:MULTISPECIES: ImmA/IrrE family metallo-endopeptidase [unclassified Pseudomonas]PMU20718.1 hypothetical protein C1X90_21730 [Pseudomonas sp. GP01-A9]PMU27884.1 hypothetical protein C1X88_18795 [Pseudomonas sp. GP01-A13]PMU36288.1 hypothetical protein C1X89_20330 [Pseudomonas sp. GP01-A8]PMU50992.1 hypothetical protein C1X85_22950 [Pseudomonas sp. GP01-A6]PMU51558.1 hypothetical protein C1X87_12810 [Pseudomonas sp. GP01-A14]